MSTPRVPPPAPSPSLPLPPPPPSSVLMTLCRTPGPPCRRPHAATRAVLPCRGSSGPGGAESVLSPGVPAPVLSPRHPGPPIPSAPAPNDGNASPVQSRRRPRTVPASANPAHTGRQPSRRQRQPVLAGRPHARQPCSVMPRPTGASRDSTVCHSRHAAAQPDHPWQLHASAARPCSRSDRPGTSSVPIQPLCHPSDCRRPATRRHPPGSHRPPPACPGPRMKRAATPLGSGRRSWQSCPCRPSFHGNRSPRSLPPRPPNRLHRPPTDQLRLPRQNR